MLGWTATRLLKDGIQIVVWRHPDGQAEVRARNERGQGMVALILRSVSIEGSVQKAIDRMVDVLQRIRED